MKTRRQRFAAGLARHGLTTRDGIRPHPRSRHSKDIQTTPLLGGVTDLQTPDQDTFPPASPSRHLCSIHQTAGSFRTKSRHASARARARLDGFASAPFRSVSIPQAPYPLHSIPPAPNCRDRPGHRARPVKTKGREATPDPDWQYGRDAPHVAQDTEIARDASHGQDTALRREAPPAAGRRAITARPAAFAALRCSPVRLAPAFAKLPDSLEKPDWSETPSLDSAACCLGLPPSPQIRPSFRCVPSAGTRIRRLSRSRDEAGNESAASAK